MIRRLFLLNFMIIFQTNSLSPMYKATSISRIQITKTLLATHVRNLQHHLTYKTPQGVIIAEHWDGSETHTYPDGKVIRTFPEQTQNQNNVKKTKCYFENWIQKLKKQD